MAQSKSITIAAEEWDVHGLMDEDTFSDYVNASLQSLFNCENLRRVFLEIKENSILKVMFDLYRSKRNLNAKELKKFVHKKYLLPTKYDVSEFIDDLSMKVPILQQVLGHEINIILRCPGCNDRVVTDFVLKCVIPLSLPPNMNPCTLQDICDHNFEL